MAVEMLTSSAPLLSATISSEAVELSARSLPASHSLCTHHQTFGCLILPYFTLLIDHAN